MSNEYDFDYFEKKMLEYELVKLETQNKTLERYLNYMSNMAEQKEKELMMLRQKVPHEVIDNINNIVNEFVENNSEAIDNIGKKHFKNIDLNDDNAAIEILQNYLNDIKKLHKNI